MATITTMTGAAFDQLPYEEGRKYELLHGELIEVSSARPKHQRIASRVSSSLEDYFDREPIGDVLPESEFALGPDDRLRPDVAVLLGGHWDSLDLEQTPIRAVAPDIAVEVLSPSEHAEVSLRKVWRYLVEAGTQEVWQFSPLSQKVWVYRGSNSVTVLGIDDTLTTPLLPGWQISIRKVFTLRRRS